MMRSNTPGARTSAPSQGLRAPAGAALARRAAAPYSRTRGEARYAQVARARRRRRGLAAGVLLALLAALALGAALAGAGAWGLYSSVGERLNEGVDDETRAVLADQQAQAEQLASGWTDTSPFYMLLLGVDSDQSRMSGDESSEYGTSEANYRSDTIILARIDPGEKKVCLVSIHRDTWVAVAGVEQKINNAYSIGGVPLAIQTVSDFAGVPITHFAQINIDGLYAIVDALGGVEVDVPYEINDEYTGWTLPAGTQVLDGEAAEVFVRSRHAYDDLGDGDRYRAANQRLFLAAVAEKLLSASPAEMVATIDTLADYVTTDLTVDQIVDLALAMRGINVDEDVYATMNPTISTYTGGVWYELSNEEYWRQIMAQVDAGEKPDSDYAYISVSDDINNPDHGTQDASADPASVSVAVKDASGAQSRGTAVAQALREAGWGVSSISTASMESSVTSVVYDDEAYLQSAQVIASFLGTAAEPAGDVWNMEGDVMVVVGMA